MAENAQRTMDGKTILVTGGAGFIGANLIHYLLGKYSDTRIINLDKLTYAGNLDNLKGIENDPRYEFVHGDIRDSELVARLMPRVQGILHLAAETHVDRSILDAGEFVLTDVYGTFVLLEALRREGKAIEFFLHISTDEVYGSVDEGFFTEGDPLEPSSPYAASKAGLNALSQSLAQALAPWGIFVGVVAPGFVETEMTAALLEGAEGDAIRSQSPLNRVALPEEIARAVLFLAAEGNEFTTGAIIDINGASYLRS